MHVDVFKERALNKDVVAIKLERKPTKPHNKCEIKVNCCYLNYRVERGMEVNVRTLVKSFWNKLSFVVLN